MRQFCVFGNPIAHSKSPLIHNFAFMSFANEIGFDGAYGRYLLSKGEALKEKFFDLKLFGANVTVPFKEYAYAQSDTQKGIAKAIGAVNTLVLENGSMVGYNTDAEGFYQTISPYGFQSALILGAGGSARALAHILKAQGIQTTIYNRTQERLKDLIQAGFTCYAMPEAIDQSFDLIINATPAGLKDNSLPLGADRLHQLFLSAKMAYDLIYGIPTPFLGLAKDLGVPIKDGKEMLLYQGALAFGLFCGQCVPLEAIISKMRLVL
ncbi:shikimate dehydrogenase [Helicobacter sp. 12S02634-8]|uniref:shikimate dehydrogenase n=1 Tax=Helicobacter sp. 12S02634-8 TaxID=1476199 RepID=UPI000BA596A2|nr:shikimate dehydrogenase [Helicobacter sp. 12S02634-8]PAF46513.1 shikimate dehydrogenase [Helicobacter sp. 12S02634-8]